MAVAAQPTWVVTVDEGGTLVEHEVTGRPNLQESWALFHFRMGEVQFISAAFPASRVVSMYPKED